MTIATFPPLPELATNDPNHVRRVVENQNRQNGGKINVTAAVTLTENAATTTLTDARLSVQSFVGLMPLTANAAAALATTHVTTRLSGSCVLNHANNAQTDRSFTVLIIG